MKIHKNHKKNYHNMNQTEEKNILQDELDEQAVQETTAQEAEKELTPEEQLQQQLAASEEK